MSGTEAVPASDGRQLTRWTRIRNYFRIGFLLRPSSRVLDPDWLPLAAQEVDVEPTLKSSLLEGPPDGRHQLQLNQTMGMGGLGRNTRNLGLLLKKTCGSQNGHMPGRTQKPVIQVVKPLGQLCPSP